jgi:CubicO group peptidase (beta-lactamase class C family)
LALKLSATAIGQSLAMLLIGNASLLAQETGVAKSQPDYSAVITAIEERLPRVMSQSGVPGMAIALVDGDSVVWAKGYGRTTTADSLPVTDTTLFSVQSISKTYTAAVVLRAVELGWLRLDDPLIKYVPEFTVRSRFGPQAARITIRQLLAHRACLPHEAPVGGSFEDSNAPFEAHIRSISQSWLLCPVGSRYNYSNLGFDLAGYVLERIGHRAFAEIADSLLLRPLGMRRSTFDFNKVRKLGTVTDGHIGARVLPLQNIPIVPSGGLYSTVRDMGRFVSYMITQGKSAGGRVLAAQHIAEMSTPQFPVPGQTAGYGLGLQCVPAFGAVRYSHSGGGLGFSAEQRWIPAYGVGVIVLANQQENANTSGVAGSVIQLMLRAKLGAEPENAPPERDGQTGVNVAHERLRRLEGEYKSSGPLVTFAVRDGRLHHITGTDTIGLTALDENEFFVGRRVYRFREGSGGGVSGVEVIDPNYSSNGNEFWALNRSPRDRPVPNRPEWSAYVGQYEVTSYGTRWVVSVSVRGGYLETSWRGGLRLTQFSPRLFFTPEGEVFEFRSDGALIVGNRRFRRSGAD